MPSAPQGAASGVSMEGGECLALVREFSHQVDHENPILSRVLNEVVRAEITSNTLLFWLLPKNKFHKSSIDQNYPEQILAFFSGKAGAPLRLECRFTDEGEVPRHTAPPANRPPAPRSQGESLIDNVISGFNGEIVSEERARDPAEIHSGEYEDTDEPEIDE